MWGEVKGERKFDRCLHVKKRIYVNLNIHCISVAHSGLIHKQLSLFIICCSNREQEEGHCIEENTI